MSDNTFASGTFDAAQVGINTTNIGTNSSAIATLNSSVNTNKKPLDNTVFFTADKDLFTYSVFPVDFVLRWIAASNQVGFVYVQNGADPSVELVFSYVSNKPSGLLGNSHQQSINTVGVRFFNPANLSVSNSDLALTANGNLTELTGSLSSSDATFTVQFYVSVFRTVDFLPVQTSVGFVTGWSEIVTG